MKGEAVLYSNLSLRLISQKPLSFFLSHESDLLNASSATHKFGCTSESPEKAYLPGDYLSTSSLLKHTTSRHGDRGLFWIVVCAAFNLRRLQMAGYFGRKAIKSGGGMKTEEKMVGKLLVHFLELLQYNTHAVLAKVTIQKSIVVSCH